MTRDMQDNNISFVDAVFYPTAENEYASYAYDFIRDISPKYVYAPDEENLSDEIRFAVMGYDSKNIRCINDADFESERDNLKITAYNEGDQKIWLNISAGKNEVLICPDGGDALKLPEEMRYPDCAVVMSENIANITALNAAAVIVSADEEDSAAAVALLRYRGVNKVFTTVDGNIVIKEHKAGVIVGGD